MHVFAVQMPEVPDLLQSLCVGCEVRQNHHRLTLKLLPIDVRQTLLMHEGRLAKWCHRVPPGEVREQPWQRIRLIRPMGLGSTSL